MLRVLIRFCVAIGVICCAGSAAFAGPAGPSLLLDAATGEVLSADRAGEPWYPASLTKVMTAYVVFQKLRAGQLTLDQKIAVSPLAAGQEPSKIGLKAGSTVSVDFALQSLLVYSANDMAYVLAEGAGGTVHDFVNEMNANAHRLGMSASHFVNPNGLFDPRHLSSARDLGLLAMTVSKEFPEYSHYFSQSYVAMGKRKLMNRNSLLRQMPEADGMKTGFVCNSGFNLIASATHEGRKLIAVVLGAANGKARADAAEAMLEAGFAQAATAPSMRVTQIANTALGGVVPSDLSEGVCKRKQPVTIVSAKDVGGWGISLGIYETAQKADMALRGRLISPYGLNAPGSAGVVRMPQTTTYAAVLWSLNQPEALSLCDHYKASKAFCDVVAPQVFTQIALMTPDEVKPKPAAAAQGGDAKKPKAKKSRRVKKSIH